MKRLFCTLMAAALALSVFGCAAPEAAGTETAAPAESEQTSQPAEAAETEAPAGDIVLRVSLMKTQWVDAMEEVKAMYLAENPQIKDIEFEIIHSGNYWDNLKGKLASENLPDIMQMNLGGILQDWSPYLMPLNGLEVLSQFDDTAIEAGTIDGNEYLVPMGAEGFGIVYNMRLLEQVGVTEIPNTFSELVSLCEKLDAAGIQPFVNHYKEANLTFVSHFGAIALVAKDDGMAFMNQLKSAEGVDLSNDAEYHDYLDFLDLTMKYGNQDAVNVDSNTAQNIFMTEGAAMITDEGSWMTPSIAATNPDLLNYVTQGAIPLTDDPSDTKLCTFTTDLCINKDTKYPEEAKKFVSWFVSDPDVLDYMANTVANMSANKNATVDPEVLGHLARDVKAYMDSGMSLIHYGYYIPDEIKTDLGALGQKYISGVITQDEFLKTYADLFRGTGE